MVFGFFKPGQAPAPDAPPPDRGASRDTSNASGWARRLRAGLAKTRAALSGKAGDLFRHFGLTTENLQRTVVELLNS